MPRCLTFIASCALALAVCAPGRGQDTPSLGDLARQAQKDKANKPPVKVLTNDDLSLSSRGTNGVLSAVLDGSSGAPALGRGAPNLSPADKFAQIDKFVDQVEAVDKATLVRNVLKDKSNVNFSGRAAWERRLFAARDVYVTQARAVLQRGRQILASAESLKGTQDPNNPRMKEIDAELQAFARDALETDARLLAVINEGIDLASQPSEH